MYTIHFDSQNHTIRESPDRAKCNNMYHPNRFLLGLAEHEALVRLAGALRFVLVFFGRSLLLIIPIPLASTVVGLNGLQLDLRYRHHLPRWGQQNAAERDKTFRRVSGVVHQLLAGTGSEEARGKEKEGAYERTGRHCGLLCGTAYGGHDNVVNFPPHYYMSRKVTRPP